VSLQAQIELITVPQDFSRLCNAVLRAEYGDDFLSIDDDRSDRGNDGYLKSEKRMFAAHCFKRVQNQSLDREIRRKMMADLRKAIQLKQEGLWQIEAWTFISNYPITGALAEPVIRQGRESNIDVGWRGPEPSRSIAEIPICTTALSEPANKRDYGTVRYNNREDGRIHF